MKKLLLVLTLILGLNSYVEKAEAGVVAFGSSVIFTDPTDTGLMVYRAGISILATVGVLIAGGITAIFNPSVGGKIAWIGLVLDQEASPESNQRDLSIYLKEKFSFIDQEDIFKNLSKELIRKYDPWLAIQTLTVDEEITREILARTDLTEKEIDLVTEELK